MKLRLLSYIFAALLAVGPAQAQSQLLLGAGKPSAAAPAGCNAFLPANFATSALYISWTTADGLGSFGMACLSGTTPVAASTLGTISGTGSVGSTGLTCGGGFFQFSNVSWLAQNSGTLYSNQKLSSTSGTPRAFIVSDGTANNLATTLVNAGTWRAQLIVGGSGIGLPNSALAGSTTVPAKVAFSYTSGAQIIYANGTNTATASGAGSITGLNASNICANQAGANPMFALVTETAFFSTALNAGTTPTLQAITQ